MDTLSTAGPPLTSPAAALSRVASFDGPVLLDLDETLYLRNSTEDFIDTARPAPLALLLLCLLDLAKPWRWTGGEPTRDVWRVRLVMALFPWTLALWRRRVRHLAAAFANGPLLAASRAEGRDPIVVTIGFLPVVGPLVAALGLPSARIVAARVSDPADRRDGKLRLAVDALGAETVRHSLVVTDSPQDLPLLAACAVPLRVVWPEARFRPALAGVYCPGVYLARVKRPGQQYVRRVILQDELPLWILCSVGLAAVPAAHVLGLALLTLSFWAVYEQGYVDNDRIAAAHEKDPRLSSAFGTEVATPPFAPWLWSVAAGASACALLRWPAPPPVRDLAIWSAVLAATALWFRLYNRLDKATRVWLFGGLQLARGGAFAVLVPVAPIAPAAIGAHVLARWVPYFLYRQRRADWPEATPVLLIRLQFALVLAAAALAVEGWSALAGWAPLALLAFMAFKARRELAQVAAAAARVGGARPWRGSEARPKATAAGSAPRA
ncbi:MAG: haloacid dehalogenase-like hydrolase [Acetobacteraceae bacterium]|nr:haloacid dehalogenase-like hydrolase [Acetobacteraceae bacterium]